MNGASDYLAPQPQTVELLDEIVVGPAGSVGSFTQSGLVTQDNTHSTMDLTAPVNTFHRLAVAWAGRAKNTGGAGAIDVGLGLSVTGGQIGTYASSRYYWNGAAVVSGEWLAGVLSSIMIGRIPAEGSTPAGVLVGGGEAIIINPNDANEYPTVLATLGGITNFSSVGNEQSGHSGGAASVVTMPRGSVETVSLNFPSLGAAIWDTGSRARLIGLP